MAAKKTKAPVILAIAESFVPQSSELDDDQLLQLVAAAFYVTVETTESTKAEIIQELRLAGSDVVESWWWWWCYNLLLQIQNREHSIALAATNCFAEVSLGSSSDNGCLQPLFFVSGLSFPSQQNPKTNK